MIKLGSKGSLRQHLIRAASGSFIIKLLNTVFTLLIAVVLARVLGADGFGVYAFCFSISQVLAVPAMLGMQQLVVREVSAYRTREEYSLIRGLLRRSRQNVFLASLALMIVAGIIAFLVAEYIDAMNLSAFWMAMLLVPLFAFLRVHNSALRGFGRIIQGQLGRVLRPAFFLILIGVLFFFFPSRLDPLHALSMHVIGATLALGILCYLLQKALPFQTKISKPEYRTRIWMKSAWPMLLAGGMQILNKETSVLMLGFLGTAEDVGFFRVAQRAAILIPFGLHAVNMALAPTASRLYTNGQIQLLQRVLTQSARAILAYALPVTLCLMIGSFWLVPLIFGSEFVPAIWPLIILCAGQLVNAGVGSVGIVLTMTQNERLTAKGVVIAAIVNLILNIILIPLWGTLGAAVATSISIILWNCLLALWLYQKLGVTTTVINKIK